MSRPSAATLFQVYKKLHRFYGPQGWWPADGRFEMIVGAILTQNTSWSSVEKAISALKAEGAIDSPLKLHGFSGRKLARIIRPVGYYNIKTKRLKNLTGFLIKRYGGSLGRIAKVRTARMREELLGVNGIGPETCDSILLYAFNRPVFVVDAYTRRIFSRHGLIAEDAPYDSAQRLFCENLPSEARVFNEFHALIVRLGKDHCRSRPDCVSCPLAGIKVLAKPVTR